MIFRSLPSLKGVLSVSSKSIDSQTLKYKAPCRGLKSPKKKLPIEYSRYIICKNETANLIIQKCYPRVVFVVKLTLKMHFFVFKHKF